MMQMKTKTAAGMAALSLKCSEARTAPRPAFCMPPSIARDRLWGTSMREIQAIP